MLLRNNSVLLDASAALAMLKNERGSDIVKSVLDISAISVVNFGEVVASLAKSGASEHDINSMLFGLFPNVIPFSRHLAILSGMMVLSAKRYGLSFCDRVCITTGISHGMKIYTADRIWKDLEMTGLEIVLIR